MPLLSLIVELPSEEKIPEGKSKRGVGGLVLKLSPASLPKYQILASPWLKTDTLNNISKYGKYVFTTKKIYLLFYNQNKFLQHKLHTELDSGVQEGLSLFSSLENERFCSV